MKKKRLEKIGVSSVKLKTGKLLKRRFAKFSLKLHYSDITNFKRASATYSTFIPF